MASFDASYPTRIQIRLRQAHCAGIPLWERTNITIRRRKDRREEKLKTELGGQDLLCFIAETINIEHRSKRENKPVALSSGSEKKRVWICFPRLDLCSNVDCLRWNIDHTS